MNTNTAVMAEQARVERIGYALGKLRATIVGPQDRPDQRVIVEISGLTQARALSLVTAMGRLLDGGVVMSAPDLLAIRDSIDNARGLASRIAPEADDSTILLESIESAHYRVRGALAS